MEPIHEDKKHRKASTIWLAIGIFFALALVVAGVLLTLAIRANSSPLPATIRKEPHFTHYYPDDTLNGFTVAKARITYDAATEVLVIPIQNGQGHKVTLTQQSAPPNLTFKDLQGQGKVIDGVAGGQAAISNVEGRIVASILTTDNTLILLNSTSATSEEVSAIAKSLQPLR
jgi:hypothetical protein